jgi:hypothetical protein
VRRRELFLNANASLLSAGFAVVLIAFIATNLQATHNEFDYIEVRNSDGKRVLSDRCPRFLWPMRRM